MPCTAPGCSAPHKKATLTCGFVRSQRRVRLHRSLLNNVPFSYSEFYTNLGLSRNLLRPPSGWQQPAGAVRCRRWTCSSARLLCKLCLCASFLPGGCASECQSKRSHADEDDDDDDEDQRHCPGGQTVTCGEQTPSRPDSRTVLH